MTDSDNSRETFLGRRAALVRLLNVGVGVAGAALLTSGSTERRAQARKLPPPKQPQRSLVSLSVETPGGGSFATFGHGSQTWLAGVEGERYNLRVQNHTNERVEIVVTVDGRDVISGRLGDYVKQRGYVLDPFGSLLIEGYRQSLDNVAAFRFADLEDSYSGRLGTPEHTGVIGLAAFAERSPVVRRKNALAPVAGDPFPGDDGQPAPSRTVNGSDRARAKEAKRSTASGVGGRAGGWAVPEGESQLGTAYGETTFAPVQEVSFKRKHKKKPDQLLVLRYDSMAGLRARGIVVDRHDHPVDHRREPWRPEPVEWRSTPERREFAPPPPPKDWWR